MIRVALVDDQELVRAGFKMVLDAQPDMSVTGEAADGRAAVELARRGDADVMVMDVRMPRLDGVAAAREICAAGPRPRVLMLTTFDLDEYAFAALKAGASGFLLKDAPPAELLFAIRAVHSGDSVVAPSTTRRLLDKFVPLLAGGTAAGLLAGTAPADGSSADAGPERLAGLTERERDVLIQVAAGLSNAEIAERLFISEATVKTHVGRILGKLGVRDRVQAVVLAYETGLVRAAGSLRVTFTRVARVKVTRKPEHLCLGTGLDRRQGVPGGGDELLPRPLPVIGRLAGCAPQAVEQVLGGPGRLRLALQLHGAEGPLQSHAAIHRPRPGPPRRDGGVRGVDEAEVRAPTRVQHPRGPLFLKRHPDRLQEGIRLPAPRVPRRFRLPGPRGAGKPSGDQPAGHHRQRRNQCGNPRIVHGPFSS